VIFFNEPIQSYLIKTCFFILQIFGRFKTPYMSTSYWQDEKKYCDRKTHYDPDMESPGLF